MQGELDIAQQQLWHPLILSFQVFRLAQFMQGELDIAQQKYQGSHVPGQNGLAEYIKTNLSQWQNFIVELKSCTFRNT